MRRTEFKELGQSGYVCDHRRIAMNYLTGWFLIDLASLIPFDLLIQLVLGGESQGLVVLRMIRLLRLMKLARMLKAARVLDRWERRAEDINHSIIAIFKLIATIVVVCHWLACFWMFVAVAGSSDERDSWVYAGGYTNADMWDQYVMCIYWVRAACFPF